MLENIYGYGAVHITIVVFVVDCVKIEMLVRMCTWSLYDVEVNSMSEELILLHFVFSLKVVLLYINHSYNLINDQPSSNRY